MSLTATIQTFLTETPAPVPATGPKVTLKDMAAQIEEKFQKLFPGSFIQVRCDDNLCSSVYARFTELPKDKWPNGIIHNAEPMQIIITPRERYEPEGGSIEYRVHESYISGRQRLPKMIAKKGSGDQVLKYVLKYIDRVKVALDSKPV